MFEAKGSHRFARAAEVNCLMKFSSGREIAPRVREITRTQWELERSVTPQTEQMPPVRHLERYLECVNVSDKRLAGTNTNLMRALNLNPDVISIFPRIISAAYQATHLNFHIAVCMLY